MFDIVFYYCIMVFVYCRILRLDGFMNFGQCSGDAPHGLFLLQTTEGTPGVSYNVLLDHCGSDCT